MSRKVWHFFVYRRRSDLPYDERLPCGGVAIVAEDESSVIWKAFTEARRRFPCKPDESLVLVRVRDRIKKDQVEMLDADWERAYAKFELMMVS